MDVRRPLRLGSMTRFSEFSEHQCFLDHELFASHLALLSSPFSGFSSMPSSSQRASLFALDLKLQKVNPKAIVLTPAVKEMLSQIRYPCPSSPLSISSRVSFPYPEISLSLRNKLICRAPSLA
jgi:hypothetical protein